MHGFYMHMAALQAQVDAVDAEVDEVGLAADIAANTTEIENIKDGTSPMASPAVETIVDPFGHVVAEFLAGGPAAVNSWRMVNSQTGGNLELIADGDDTDISVQVSPKGTGVFEVPTNITVAAVPVALSAETTKPDTSGIVDAATAKAVIDEILADLVTARVYTA